MVDIIVERLKHTEFKVNMKDIDMYNHDFINKGNNKYEYISIKASIEHDYWKSTHKDNTEYRLFKDIDFKFIMRQFYELVESDCICDIEMAMLEYLYILNRVNIPEGYEFGGY